MTNKYGPQTYQIEKMLERIKTLTPDEIIRLCAARNGISPSAWLASWIPAHDAAQDAARNLVGMTNFADQDAVIAAWLAERDREAGMPAGYTAALLAEEDREAGMHEGYHAADYAASNAAWDSAWDGPAWDESWHEAWNVWNAAHTAWNAAGNAGLPAGWPVDWLEAQNAAQDTVRSAISAVYAKHFIGQHGYTREHYNIQTKPWRQVIGEFE
jgi:hypothetical protein